jgi:hypothetical protein
VDDEDPEHEEGGNLTFDTTNEGHQGYQGVFFRWGSLGGVSPAKVINPNSNENAFEGESVPVYVPDTNEETGWRATTSTAEGCTTWSDTPPGVPYMNAGSYPTTASDRNNTYLIDAFQGDPATMYAHLRGDICQYLSKTGAVSGDYRLPTSSEFGTGWTLGGTSGQYSGTSKAEGTTIMIGLAAPNNRAYVENARMGGVTLPASGRRWSSTDGTLNIVGNAGYYWSGSASGGAAYYLNFTGTSVTPDGTHNRTYAMPIRCIKN